MNAPSEHNGAAASAPANLDVIVVGAGVGGLYTLYRLRKMGLRVRVFEAGSGVGGTWFWNRYPGCRCDVESMEYSYSFDNDLQQEWKWPERYGTQPEILRYINHVAQRFDLMRDVQLNTRVTSAVFDEERNQWTVTTDRGDRVSAPYCVMATGNLSTPRVPSFKGVESFKGKWYHTGLWPHEGVDFTGLRVGVIGTGSSGVQSIPIIAEQARHLHVFQRTANYSVPARHAPIDPERERRHKAEYPARRKAAFDTPFGIAGYPPPTKSALEASDEERQQKYEAKWSEGGSISYLYSYNDLLTNQAANDTASEFVRQKIRSIVRDQKVAQLLCPNDHPIGTKRLCVDSYYYETYNRGNVTLVNARSAPILEITAKGLRTSQAEYEFDAIVFATGFDAMTGALAEIDIRTSLGVSMREAWSSGPRSYLGLMVAGLPNLFLITGPGSPGVKSQMIMACEQHADWIGDCIAYLRARGLNRIEAEEKAQQAWVEHVNDVANATLYPLANSWYMGANIPGKPRVFMPYVGGVPAYTKRVQESVKKGYEGFILMNVRQDSKVAV
ncbi:MAG: flavin-containing monooxygenase [Burkholderiales bacterium]